MRSSPNQSDADARIRQLVEYLRTSANFPRQVGVRFDVVHPGRVELSLELEERHLNGAGTVHGGVHATLMDTAMAVALLAHGLRVSTTQMNIHYLAAIATGRLVCRAEIVHRSRRSALLESRIEDGEGRLLATATAAFRLYEREPAEAASDDRAASIHPEKGAKSS